MNDGRSYATPLEIGEVMTGETVAHVLVSNNSAYVTGDVVLARTGWRTHALPDGAGLRKLDPVAAPVTTGLGVLGMPGFTAYGGLRVIGKPQPGETVVVAAASGSVGSLVGQLAGARAVGIAGGPQKCAFVKDELRFDAAVDHRAPDFAARHGPQAAVAQVKAEAVIKATGRIYRQEYVVFLRAADDRIAYLREYFDPTRAAKSMNATILDLEPWL